MFGWVVPRGRRSHRRAKKRSSPAGGIGAPAAEPSTCAQAATLLRAEVEADSAALSWELQAHAREWARVTARFAQPGTGPGVPAAPDVPAPLLAAWEQLLKALTSRRQALVNAEQALQDSRAFTAEGAIRGREAEVLFAVLQAQRRWLWEAREQAARERAVALQACLRESGVAGAGDGAGRGEHAEGAPANTTGAHPAQRPGPAQEQEQPPPLPAATSTTAMRLPRPPPIAVFPPLTAGISAPLLQAVAAGLVLTSLVERPTVADALFIDGMTEDGAKRLAKQLLGSILGERARREARLSKPFDVAALAAALEGHR